MKNFENKFVTVFGDSVVKGVYLDDGKLKSTEQNAISIINECYDAKIINNSSFGQTLFRVFEKGSIDRYLQNLEFGKRNILVINLGGNDSDYDWLEVAKSPKLRHSSKTPIRTFEKMLSDIVGKAQSAGVEVILATLFPIDGKRYFDTVISKIADGEKAMEFLKHDLTNISRHQEIFNYVILKVASKFNCQVIDIRNEFLTEIDMLSFMHNDGVHPNAKGQLHMSRIISKFIETEYCKPKFDVQKFFSINKLSLL